MDGYGRQRRGINTVRSTAIGGDDGEPVTDGAPHGGDSPAPAYHSIDKSQYKQRTPSNEDAALQGIRIDVERAMSLDL